MQWIIFLLLAQLSITVTTAPDDHPSQGVQTTSTGSYWVWRGSNSTSGSSWITALLVHRQTQASLQRNLISATFIPTLCLCHSLPRVHNHRWGTERISTFKLSNSSPLVYQTSSLCLKLRKLQSSCLFCFFRHSGNLKLFFAAKAASVNRLFYVSVLFF